MTLFFYFLALFSVFVTVYATNDVYDAYDTHMSKMRRNCAGRYGNRLGCQKAAKLARRQGGPSAGLPLPDVTTPLEPSVIATGIAEASASATVVIPALSSTVTAAATLETAFTGIASIVPTIPAPNTPAATAIVDATASLTATAALPDLSASLSAAATATQIVTQQLPTAPAPNNPATTAIVDATASVTATAALPDLSASLSAAATATQIVTQNVPETPAPAVTPPVSNPPVSSEPGPAVPSTSTVGGGIATTMAESVMPTVESSPNPVSPAMTQSAPDIVIPAPAFTGVATAIVSAEATITNDPVLTIQTAAAVATDANLAATASALATPALSAIGSAGGGVEATAALTASATNDIAAPLQTDAAAPPSPPAATTSSSSAPFDPNAAVSNGAPPTYQVKLDGSPFFMNGDNSFTPDAQAATFFQNQPRAITDNSASIAASIASSLAAEGAAPATITATVTAVAEIAAATSAPVSSTSMTPNLDMLYCPSRFADCSVINLADRAVSYVPSMPGSPAASEQPVAFAASPEGGISLAYTDWPEASELFSWTLGGTLYWSNFQTQAVQIANNPPFSINNATLIQSF